MKILFKNTTKYSKKLYEKYCNFHNKTYFISSTLFTAIVCFAILFCFASQLLNHNYTLLFVFGCFFTGFILWRILHPFQNAKRELGKSEIKNEDSYTFCFYDKFFTIENSKEIIEMKYYQIYKVFYTKDLTYIYTDKTHAFFFENNCFSIGTCLDFKNFMHKKCKLKFRNKC